MASRTPRPVRTQLMALVAVLVVPLVTLLAWSSYREYREAILQAQTTAVEMAERTSTSTQQLLAGARDLMEGFSTVLAPELMNPESCRDLLRDANAIMPLFVNLLVADMEGGLHCSAEPPSEGTVVSVAHRDWFQALVRTHAFSVGAPNFGQITGRWVMALASPIRDEGGALFGVLAASIDLNTFQTLLAGVELGPGELITITTDQRIVIARSQEAERFVGQLLPPEEHPSVEIGPDRFVEQGTDYTGVARVWGHVIMPETGWHVYAGTDQDQIYAPVLASSIRDGLISLIGVVVALILAGSLYRGLSGSLTELVAGVRNASGERPVPVPTHAPAELQELATQFNTTLAARSRAEAAERSAKERFRSMLDNAVFGIVQATVDGEILDANPAFLTLLGYESVEQVRAVSARDLYLDPEQRDSIVAATVTGGDIDNVELNWKKKDATPITVRANGRLLDTESLGPVFEVIVEDITEEKRLEEQLRQTQKMEAVGRLAGGVAHDFNNLLTVIGGHAALLLSDLGPQHPSHLDALQISDAVDRASTVTRQLLTFSRRDTATAQVVELSTLVSNLDRMLRRLIGEEIRLETRFDSDLRPVLANPGRLEQVVVNLVLNARDAVSRGGHIRISARNEFRTVPPAASEGDPGEDWVVLAAQDDGCGMDAKTQQHMFEPFFTTKPKGRGTGLGLATVYGIVQQAGGHIAVDSAPGRGSRIEIWLRAAGAALDEPIPNDRARPHPRGTETVLVAEDEDALRGMVCRVLSDAGYNVLQGRDGVEALERAAGFGGTIDLLLTDVVMPRMRGTELAERLVDLRPGIGVLFTSGYTDDQEMEERLAGNGTAMLRKPFRPSELCQRVRTMLDERAGAAVRRGPRGSNLDAGARTNGEGAPPNGGAPL